MNSDDNKEQKNDLFNTTDKITFKTPKTTYSCSQSWLENEALKDILVDLIIEDL